MELSNGSGVRLGWLVVLGAASACSSTSAEAIPDGGPATESHASETSHATGSKARDAGTRKKTRKSSDAGDCFCEDDAGGSDAESAPPDADVEDAPAPTEDAHTHHKADAHVAPQGFPLGLHVVAGTGGAPGRILDGAGNVARFHGVDRSGTEFACTYQAGGDAGAGFFDGPNDQAGVTAMLGWHVNVVRVPLNEDCWLGINGLPMNDTAADYRAAIVAWVELLNANGMAAIVDLHWAAPGSEATNSSVGQLPMADADHAPTFWTSVATTFAGHSGVVFDLYNEPYITDWTCWLAGAPAAASCAVDTSNTPYDVAGMASLLQAVRSTGAKNVVMMGGLGYSGDLSSWVSTVQTLPNLPAPLDGLDLENVAASWHEYDFGSDQTGCPSQYNGYTGTCDTGAMTGANASITTVLAAGFPVVMGEVGISAFSTSTAAMFTPTQVTGLEGWMDSTLTWLEGQDQGYLGWSWNTDTDPVLVTDYSGTPTVDFGVTYKAHLAQY